MTKKKLKAEIEDLKAIKELLNSDVDYLRELIIKSQERNSVKQNKIYNLQFSLKEAHSIVLYYVKQVNDKEGIIKALEREVQDNYYDS
jgi:hypothetical protein